MSDERGSVLDASAAFEGKLVGTNITLEGRFQGSIEASGVLRIQEGSDVEATVKAKRVEIGGKFQGEIDAETLSILERGRATGVFRAGKLAMREGAKLDGQLEVGEIAREEASAPKVREGSAS